MIKDHDPNPEITAFRKGLREHRAERGIADAFVHEAEVIENARGIEKLVTKARGWAAEHSARATNILVQLFPEAPGL